jgi:midasin
LQVEASVAAPDSPPPLKKSRRLSRNNGSATNGGSDLVGRWRAFAAEASAARRTVEVAEGGFAFHFVEGALVTAVRQGHWLLLDEINLAPPQLLERISGLLEGSEGGLVLLERGDSEVVERHPGFRLFAAMNPATDVGKRQLPAHISAHFTELYVSEPSSDADLVRTLSYCFLCQELPSGLV